MAYAILGFLAAFLGYIVPNTLYEGYNLVSKIIGTSVFVAFPIVFMIMLAIQNSDSIDQKTREITCNILTVVGVFLMASAVLLKFVILPK